MKKAPPGSTREGLQNGCGYNYPAEISIARLRLAAVLSLPVRIRSSFPQLEQHKIWSQAQAAKT
jgi:hypothetical protein